MLHFDFVKLFLFFSLRSHHFSYLFISISFARHNSWLNDNQIVNLFMKKTHMKCRSLAVLSITYRFPCTCFIGRRCLSICSGNYIKECKRVISDPLGTKIVSLHNSWIEAGDFDFLTARKWGKSYKLRENWSSKENAKWTESTIHNAFPIICWTRWNFLIIPYNVMHLALLWAIVSIALKIHCQCFAWNTYHSRVKISIYFRKYFSFYLEPIRSYAI